MIHNGSFFPIGKSISSAKLRIRPFLYDILYKLKHILYSLLYKNRRKDTKKNLHIRNTHVQIFTQSSKNRQKFYAELKK